MSREDHRLHDEILALRKQLEESGKNMRKSDGMQFSAKEFIVVATSTLFAFAGMLVENEIVLYFCLAIPCLAYLYVCLKHPGSILWRSIAAVVVVGVFALMIFLVHRRGLQKEQDDVDAKLSIQPFIPTSHNVLRTGITVTNDGGADIAADHAVQCLLRRIVYAPYGGISGPAMQTTLPEKTILRAHGGGETSYCIAGIQAFPPDTHAICADITVTVSYSLLTQPDIKKTKQLRFVAGGEDFVYRQQPVDYPGDYCPEPRMPPQPPFN